MAKSKSKEPKEQIKTPESTAETKRKHALDNLKRRKELLIAATAFFVEEGKPYGEAGSSAVDQFLYGGLTSSPKFTDPETGKEVDVIMHGLRTSRQGGKKYTGNISEMKIIQDCAAIVQESALRLKVEDVYELIGADLSTEPLKGKYISDLKGNDKEFGQKLMSVYVDYLTSSGVATALTAKKEYVKKNLEAILRPEERN